MAKWVTFTGDEQNTGSYREYNGKQYPKSTPVLEHSDKIAAKLACLGCFEVSEQKPAEVKPAAQQAQIRPGDQQRHK